MKRCLAFALIAIIAINGILAAPYPNDVQLVKASCVPLYGKCQITDQCCPGSVCLVYAAKCIPKMGIQPVEDTRPIGDGPFPLKMLYNLNHFDDNALELEDGIE